MARTGTAADRLHRFDTLLVSLVVCNTTVVYRYDECLNNCRVVPGTHEKRLFTCRTSFPYGAVRFCRTAPNRIIR